jgi:MSHA pilin protein MshA
MKRQQGFTLIELVVVIIILGILAVTAAPKFINVQADARTATLNGVKAAMQGANSMIYSKAILAGLNTATNQAVTVAPGVTVTTDFGYLDASNNLTNLKANLEKALDMTFQTLGNDNVVVTTEDFGVRRVSATVFKIVPKGKTASATVANACHLEYTAATSVNTVDKPQYTLTAATTSGC